MNTPILFAQDNAMPNIVGGMFGLVALFWLIGLAASVFWSWMPIDAVVNEPRTEDKILGFLVIFFLHFIGVLVYLFARRSGRPRTLP